ncbi:MAG: hypothetical protein RLZZ502_144 [Pseudomonadota bacterium]
MSSEPEHPHSGSLFVIAAPSGAGKTSLVKALLQRELSLMLSISHTTRAARATEHNGVDYFFISKDEFLTLKEQNHFVESAEVYGNLYGTSRPWLNQQLSAGRDVVLEIDWQGAKQIKAQYPNAVMIYILPPSLAVLEARLRSRGLDSSDVIMRRIAAAQEDMSHLADFEYVMINQDFNTALQDLSHILFAARLRTPVMRVKHQSLINSLVS